MSDLIYFYENIETNIENCKNLNYVNGVVIDETIYQAPSNDNSHYNYFMKKC